MSLLSSMLVFLSSLLLSLLHSKPEHIRKSSSCYDSWIQWESCRAREILTRSVGASLVAPELVFCTLLKGTRPLLTGIRLELSLAACPPTGGRGLVRGFGFPFIVSFVSRRCLAWDKLPLKRIDTLTCLRCEEARNDCLKSLPTRFFTSWSSFSNIFAAQPAD